MQITYRVLAPPVFLVLLAEAPAMTKAGANSDFW